MPEPLDADRLAKLFEAAAAVAEQSDLHTLLETIVVTAMELTEARYGALGILGAHGTLIEFLHSGLESGQADAIGALPSGRGVLGTITKTGKCVRLEHISEHADSVGFPDHHPPMESFLGVPVKAGDTVFGNLYLTEKVGGFQDADQQLVEALALIGGAAVTNAQLHERLRRVALVEDRERIARDVHDEIIQDLFAVGLSLQALALRAPDREARASLEDSAARVDDSITALRTFIFNLRRSPQSRDLGREIRELLEELASAYEVDPRVAITGAAGRLPDDVAQTMLFIIKESASNALRHSGSESLEVGLAIDDHALHLVISDKGDGFDTKSVSMGMGLQNLRDRAEAAGGTLLVDSEIGVGTRVTLDLPLRD